jgi:localization factor PodJL
LSTPVSDWDAAPAADDFVMDAEHAAPEGDGDLDFTMPAPSDAFGDEAQPAAEPRAQAQPKRSAALGATADASFLAAARKTIRSNGAAGASQWSDPEAQTSSGGGRSLLIGASVLGFGAVAAAAAMLALEALGGNAEPASRTAQPATPETLSALFADASPTSETRTEASAAAGQAEPPQNPSVADAEPAPQGETPPAAATPSVTPSQPVTAPVDAAGAPQTAPTQTAQTAPAPAVDPDAALIAAVTVEPATLDDAAAAGDPIARYQLGLAPERRSVRRCRRSDAPRRRTGRARRHAPSSA